MRRVLHMALHDTRLYVGARESLFFMFVCLGHEGNHD